MPTCTAEGRDADRHHRRRHHTAAFGLLPTIAQVGVIAPVIFLVAAAGAGHLRRRRRGLHPHHRHGIGAGAMARHDVGPDRRRRRRHRRLLASFIFLITSSIFPGDAFAVWGWRFMFFSGLLSSLLGWFIFREPREVALLQGAQAPAGSKQGDGVEAAPVKDVFSGEYRAVLLVNLLITFGGGAGYYLTSGYLPSFLKVVNAVPNQSRR